MGGWGGARYIQIIKQDREETGYELKQENKVPYQRDEGEKISSGEIRVDSWKTWYLK